MSFYFVEIAPHLAQVEAGFVDHPSDKGGPTRYGITEKVARSWGFRGDMRVFPLVLAHQIYETDYVTKPGFGRIALLSVPVAKELVDTGVNMGVDFAGLFLQRILNAMNGQGDFWPELKVDGKVGDASVAAFKAFMAKRGKAGETVMLRALNSLQGARYVEITEARPLNEDFVYGWFANRVFL